MANQWPPDVAKELRPMIRLHAAYSVLICPHDKCRKAVQPSAFTRHSHEEHGTTIRARQQLEAFIEKLGWKYDSRTVQLPPDGSQAQPTIPVSGGIECRLCVAESRHPTFKTRKQKSMRKIMKAHGNKVHKRNMVPDNELYREIRVQTWFRGNGEARYWRVKEDDDGARQTPVAHGRTEVAADAIRGEGDGTVDNAVITVPSADDPVDTPKEDATATVIVIDSDDELLVPRRPIRAVESVSTPEEEVTAAGIVIDSDDEVLVPRSRGPIGAVEVDSSDESNGDADYIPSSDEDGDSSTVETETSDAESIEACQTRTVVIAPRSRKRKVRPASARDIDSDNDPYQPCSPSFNGRSPKRQQRMSPFVDSGVVMPPSSEHRVRVPGRADDGIITRSSPPIVGWTIQSQADSEEGLPDAGRAADEATHGADEDPESTVPSPVPFVFGRRQPTSEALQRHLGTWCQACPSCVSEMEVGRVMHHVEDCWRAATVEIIKSTRVTQRHIEERGGFGGRDGCPRCGVPRTICQRWQARPGGGGGWEEIAEQACQYEKKLTVAVITMLMDGCPEGWAVAEAWMTHAGVVPTKRDEVFEWFREAAWWADMAMEVSRMVRVFHMLAEKNGKYIRR
jgi:hypothetical protein